MPVSPSTSNWLIFFPVAMAIVVAMQLSAAMRGVPRDSLVSRVMNQLVVTLFALALFGLAIRFSPLGAVWMIVLAGLVIVIWWKHRALERSHVLLLLQAAENDRDREFMAAELYRHNGGQTRRKAYHLFGLLRQGVAWQAAIEQTRLASSVPERIAVRLQARYGISPWDSEEGENNMQSIGLDQQVQQLLGRLMIVSWAIFLGPALYFYLSFILPNFLQMFAELGVKNSPLLQFFADLDTWFWTSNLSRVLLLVVPCIYLLVLAPVLFWLFPQLANLPLIRSLFSGYHQALGLRAFSRVSARERDLQAACEVTAEVIPLGWLARRYRLAAKGMMNGQKPEAALQSAGVIKHREASLLSSSFSARGTAAKNASWPLQQLAAWKLEHLLAGYQVFVQCFVVLSTLFLAVVVGLMAVVSFEVLAKMIEGVGKW